MKALPTPHEENTRVLFVPCDETLYQAIEAFCAAESERTGYRASIRAAVVNLLRAALRECGFIEKVDA